MVTINLNDEEKLTKTLLKKAMGYSVDEVVEEYVNDENELKLVKKKITKKHIPPDINAAKALLEKSNEMSMEKLKNMSDEELQSMRKKILAEIAKGGSNL